MKSSDLSRNQSPNVLYLTSHDRCINEVASGMRLLPDFTVICKAKSLILFVSIILVGSHNPQVAGSSPATATISSQQLTNSKARLVYILPHDWARYSARLDRL